jgi:ADP-ribosyl-[dinitrogen reductase] hydrolase
MAMSSDPIVPLAERYRGCLLGLAAGDALGTTLEFSRPGSFTPIDDMVGGGPFRLPVGAWTDDTSMALCLAESLIQVGAFDPIDQLRRYVRWWRAGYLSSTGTCFDIGSTVSDALARFERTGEPWCGSTDPNTAGNGSLMQLAPIVLAFRSDPVRAVDLAGDSSRTTHGALEAIAACRYYAALLLGALAGTPKDGLLAPDFHGLARCRAAGSLPPAIDAVASGSFRDKNPPAIRGTGYVVRSLEAALWAFARSSSFREGALLAVNLGDDADTTGAIYGQLAGAYYGESGIPGAWRARLIAVNQLIEMADTLFVLADGV